MKTETLNAMTIEVNQRRKEKKGKEQGNSTQKVVTAMQCIYDQPIGD